MSRFKISAGIVVVIFCFVAELFLLKNYKGCIKEIVIILAIAITILWLLVKTLKKTELLFVTVFYAFKAGLANMLGLFLIFYMLIQFGLLTNYLSSYVVDNNNIYSLIICVFYLLFFVLPFLIIALFSNKSSNKYPDPKVLISTLSKNKYERIEEFIKNDFDESKLNDTVHQRFWNWLPTIKILKQYPSIKHLYLFVSSDVIKEFEGFSIDNNNGLDIYKTMLSKKGLLPRVSLQFIYVSNPVNYSEYKVLVESKLKPLFENKKISEDKLLFDLTSGTAITSIVMMMQAFKGKRRAIYMKQEGNYDVEIIEPDIHSFKELWQEILHSL